MILAAEGGTCDVPSAGGDQIPGNDGVSLTAVVSGAKSTGDRFIGDPSLMCYNTVASSRTVHHRKNIFSISSFIYGQSTN